MITPKGAVAALKAFQAARSKDVVTAEELLRRARICAGCPQNLRTTGVSFLTRISATLGHAANQERVPDNIRDRKCNACGCALLLLLPAKPEHLHRDSPTQAKKRPEFCWIKNLPQNNSEKSLDENQVGIEGEESTNKPT